MFRSYLKTALRNLTRHRIYTAINAIGLAIGLAFCTLTFLFVHNEWTYDTFHTNADRIYRLYVKNSKNTYNNTPSLLGPAIADAFPNLTTLRFNAFLMGGNIGPDDLLYQKTVAYADPTIFDILSIPFIKGDPNTALQNKQSIVITEQIAQTQFGKNNPLGQTLSLKWGKDMREFVVTGVVKHLSQNYTHYFDVLMLYEPQPYQQKWNYYVVDTYVLLPQNMAAEQITQQLPKLATTWWGEKNENEVKLQALNQMHLNPDIPGKDVSTPMYSYVLSGIALLILFIACVNFTTLTLGRQGTRTREVGLRKVVGAKRTQIAKQFMGESLLLIAVAFLLGCVLIELILPKFNTLAGKSFVLSDAFNTATLTFIFLLITTVAITAGGYPALILSQMHPTQILTNRLQLKSGNRFGKILIIFQFALSIFLVIGTLIMANQLTYLRTKPLGYQTDHVLSISTYGLEQKNKKLPVRYKDALSTNPAITHMTWLNHQLNSNMSSSIQISYQDGNDIDVENISIDYDFFKTLDVALIAGRAYDKDFSTDAKEALIINETLAEKLGLENPVGETIKLGKRDKTIIGVTQDFHFRSLHEKISPAILRLHPNMHWRLVVRIHPENVPATIAYLKEKWQEIAPDQTFSYSFVDEALHKQYHKEERWNQMVQYATTLAIFIAAMGAFGLAALTITRRTREIGIRKVLGASQTQILSLLSREFIIHISIASLIAFPISYYVLTQWLQYFAYRIDLSISLFLMGSLIMLFVVLTTVGTQALKTARSNPVDALRCE